MNIKILRYIVFSILSYTICTYDHTYIVYAGRKEQRKTEILFPKGGEGVTCSPQGGEKDKIGSGLQMA